jgi:hypothetical protein
MYVSNYIEYTYRKSGFPLKQSLDHQHRPNPVSGLPRVNQLLEQWWSFIP